MTGENVNGYHGSGGTMEPSLSKDQLYRRRKGEEYRHKERERWHGRDDKHRQKARMKKPFVGVDGEGRNLDNGYHAYFMLRAGDYVLWNRPMDKRLRSSDMLAFLSALDPTNEYVAYFFDYDVAKILEDLPFAKLDRLVHREQRKRNTGGYFAVDWNGYEVEYFPHKELKVRKAGGTWITINDVGTFFQAAFIKTITQWEIGTPEQREQIAEGKELRGEFATIDDEYIDKYNALECVLLADLMTQFRDICVDLDYIPRKWQGPGQLAEAMLTKHGIPKNRDLPIFEDVSEYSLSAFGRYAYYGGRFEITMVGRTIAPVVQADINSAYPWALQHVPCLVHGEWHRDQTRTTLPDAELSICFGTFNGSTDSPKRSLLMGLPVRRDDGSIHYPVNGRGWYWSFEIRSAIHQEFMVYDRWVYTRKCDCEPFDFLRGLYKERKRLGKTTKGMVLKLIMNSVYGKLVQSIGNPTYSNTIWSSFITAYTRTQIANAIHSLPGCKEKNSAVYCAQDVFMVATDAIVTRDYDSFDLEFGSELGQWDKTVHENGLFIIQPGVYFDPVGDNTDTYYKTRGVPKSKVVEHRQEFLDGFTAMVESGNFRNGDVHLPFTLFVGIKQALVRKNMRLMGQFLPYIDPETGEEGRRTSFDWTTKREPEPFFYLSGASFLRTRPYYGMEEIEDIWYPIQTVPYDKDIGGLVRNAVMRESFEGQPDWVGTT